MGKQWFVKLGDQPTGPFTASQIKQMAQEGHIAPGSFVAQGADGTANTKWVAASTVKGLAFKEDLAPPERDTTDVESAPVIVDREPQTTEPQPAAVPHQSGKGPVYQMKGVNDLLEVYENKLVITPKGVMGFLNKGLKGQKEIPFRSITAIQFKKAGSMTKGYLQFTIPGGKESKSGLMAAVRDENTFMFGSGTGFGNDALNRKVEEIKRYIETQQMARESPPAPQAASLTDELAKLAILRDQGILSEDEFEAAKHRLIHR